MHERYSYNTVRYWFISPLFSLSVCYRMLGVITRRRHRSLTHRTELQELYSGQVTFRNTRFCRWRHFLLSGAWQLNQLLYSTCCTQTHLSVLILALTQDRFFSGSISLKNPCREVNICSTHRPKSCSVRLSVWRALYDSARNNLMDGTVTVTLSMSQQTSQVIVPVITLIHHRTKSR